MGLALRSLERTHHEGEPPSLPGTHNGLLENCTRRFAGGRGGSRAAPTDALDLKPCRRKNAGRAQRDQGATRPLDPA